MITPLDRMCYSKRRFDTEEQALEAGKKAWTAFNLRAYLCPNCNHWHLTKNGSK